MKNSDGENNIKLLPTIAALSIFFLGFRGIVIAVLLGLLYMLFTLFKKGKDLVKQKTDQSVDDLFNNSREDNDNILEHYSYSPTTANHVNEDNMNRYSVDRCDNREHRIEELKDLYKAGIIDKAEYNERIASIV